ncbi:Hint domain-containing protein [Roseobacter sp. YSTF-M11]|uniref:Hint domain-containing protein n=1 Tax=Roseobacter insulae TaxID=2859783 RepID=A0A9X1FU50_9RHOB|nr:Hint domain-containing protein [Roseobacter insulae]MBW4706943.1 Hint domain-containing protein [Roseobacter insulae]
MAWLAISDHKERRFSLRGVGHDRHDSRLYPGDDGFLLARGSLTFETRLSPDGRPQVLLGYSYGWPDQRSLTFQAIPGGGISLVQVQGENIAHAALQHSTPARTDVLRITFSWDAPNAWARLTVERPEEHQIASVMVRDVRPMALQDLRNMLMAQEDHGFASDVVFAALSDQIEPVGPMPSLSPLAAVATPNGYRALGTLKRGDTVYTRGGDIVPVLHRVDRTVPARGSFAPVRLRAPYFGLLEDVIVTPEQRLVIDGSEVEYLFSQEAVLTPARHLINGFAALSESTGPTQQYSQVILPGHEAMMVAGTALESLYIGRLRRKPAHLPATVLRGFDRNSLPEHGRAAFKVLKWFEAIHLARQRAA